VPYVICKHTDFTICKHERVQSSCQILFILGTQEDGYKRAPNLHKFNHIDWISIKGLGFYQSEQEARFHYPLEHPIYRTWCYKISNEQHKVLGAVKSI
jgi:hypothetical protein